MGTDPPHDDSVSASTVPAIAGKPRTATIICHGPLFHPVIRLAGHTVRHARTMTLRSRPSASPPGLPRAERTHALLPRLRLPATRRSLWAALHRFDPPAG